MGQQPPNARPLRVLVVEDYQDARESLCFLIGMWGHACGSAPAGQDAVQTASAFLPDVVLMDIGLRGRMDGYETACQMRKLPGLSGAVFVAITGYGMSEDVRRSRDAGFVTHLVKPVAPEEMRTMLAHFAAVVCGVGQAHAT